MELAAKYTYKVYQEGSFSKAAEALYISQPALSSMIAKLERELGFKVFDRSTSPLTLTQKGQIYVEMLEEVLNSEATMYKKLEHIAKRQTQQLGIGTSIFLANYIMPDVCKTIISLYPDIRIRLNMGQKGAHDILSRQLAQKNFDFIIGYSYDGKTQAVIPIANAKTLVAVKNDFVSDELRPYAMNRIEALRGDSEKEINGADLYLLKNMPFITADAYTGYHRKIANLTSNNYSLSNISVANIRNLSMNFEMMRSGLGATITNNLQIVHPLFDDEEIVYFAINKPGSTKTLRAVFRSEDSPSEEALRFAEVFKEILTNRISKTIESASTIDK